MATPWPGPPKHMAPKHRCSQVRRIVTATRGNHGRSELIEHGRDFDDAKEQAARIATQRNLEYASSLQRDFVVGFATYAFELFTAVVDLYTV